MKRPRHWCGTVRWRRCDGEPTHGAHELTHNSTGSKERHPCHRTLVPLREALNQRTICLVPLPAATHQHSISQCGIPGFLSQEGIYGDAQHVWNISALCGFLSDKYSVLGALNMWIKDRSETSPSRWISTSVAHYVRRSFQEDLSW